MLFIKKRAAEAAEDGVPQKGGVDEIPGGAGGVGDLPDEAASRGVPPEDVFCDHAGFSTRESMVRARDIFGVRTALVVTQTYHEYRALYLGRELGLTVYGTASDQEEYLGQLVREVREVLARDKAFFQIKTGNDRAVGGEPIPITGDGRVSHGE